MPTLQEQAAQRDFSYGIVRDVGPHMIDPRACNDHVNGLYEEDGSPFKRGGAQAKDLDYFNLILGYGPSLYWPLNQIHGAVDMSGNLREPDVLGGLEIGANNSVALDFDPWTTDFNDAAHGVQLESGTTWPWVAGQTRTFMGWAYRDTNGTADALFGALGAGGATHPFFQLSAGSGNLTGSLNGGGETETWAAAWPGTGQWVHWAIVVRPGVSISLYINGGLVSTQAHTAAYTADATGLAVGFQGAAAAPFDGRMSHFSVFDYELTGFQIAVAKAIADISPNKQVWVSDNYFDSGQRTLSASQADFYVMNADDSSLINIGGNGLLLPRQSAMLEGMLFIGGTNPGEGHIYGGSQKSHNYNAGSVAVTNGSKTVTGTGTAFLTNIDAGSLFQRDNSERVYVVKSVDSNTQLTLRDEYQGATGSGITSYDLRDIYTMTTTDPYTNGQFYCECANRLFTAQGNSVRFTQIGAPHDWTFEAGIFNRHDFQGKVTGLAAIGTGVLVFTTLGVWLIDGVAHDIVDSAGNANHRVSMLSRDLVCYGLPATWEQAQIVACTTGIFLIDGVSRPQRISHPIDALYQEYVNSGYMPGQGAVYADHYILPIISGAAEVIDVLVAKLARPIEVSGQRGYPWARWGGHDVACPTFEVRSFDDPALPPTLLGANANLRMIVDVGPCFFPTEQNALGADGRPPEWSLVTRDFETGGLTKNVVRTVRPRYEFVGASGFGDHEIQIGYGFGVAMAGGNEVWDENDWANTPDDEDTDLYWGDDEDHLFVELDCELGESDGLEANHCRVNEDCRFIRYRLRNSSATTRLRFRSLEHFIRPSNAVRR
jgi:hypothetical protein